MNDRLAADLGRWEQGELRSDELARCHPDGEPDELLQMHARVSLAMSATDEQPDLGWGEIEARLDLDLDAEAERDDELGSRRRRVPLLKLVIAFVAGALVNPFQPADRAIDGLRAVARSTGHAVVEEVTDVFGPMIPPRTAGVLVLDPGNTQNLSAVAPQAMASPPDPAEPGESTADPVSPSPTADQGSEPESQPTSEPRDVVTQDPVESDKRATGPTEPGDPDDSDDADESEETTSPSDPAPEPDRGPPSTPPGQQHRAERSPIHGGGRGRSAGSQPAVHEPSRAHAAPSRRGRRGSERVGIERAGPAPAVRDGRRATREGLPGRRRPREGIPVTVSARRFRPPGSAR